MRVLIASFYGVQTIDSIMVACVWRLKYFIVRPRGVEFTQYRYRKLTAFFGFPIDRATIEMSAR